jgi:hypothetical protein
MNAFVPDILGDKTIMNLIHAHKTSIHVAIIVKRNKVIAMATNKIGTRSRGAGWSDCTIHAEKNVVRELGNYEQMRGATMYVIRISRSKDKYGQDKVQNSEPCHDCHLFLGKCIKQYGLRRVFYSTTEFVELNLDNCPSKRPPMVPLTTGQK